MAVMEGDRTQKHDSIVYRLMIPDAVQLATDSAWEQSSTPKRGAVLILSMTLAVLNNAGIMTYALSSSTLQEAQSMFCIRSQEHRPNLPNMISEIQIAARLFTLPKKASSWAD